ncbi:MAG: TlyA family rRNA (cytidine-2'-O)-methyltransferase, partial [Chthoniobacterales bacterium]
CPAASPSKLAVRRSRRTSTPRDEVGRGGVGRDAAAHSRAVEKIRDFSAARGWAWGGVTDSPITGADGNREFLCLIRP